MDEILTSNQLTGIYGQEPAKKQPIELTRGYIVYLEMFGATGQGGIYTRTFYLDFPSNTEIPDQLAFEKAVIAKANSGGLKGMAKSGRAYPEIFDDQIQTVHFGWRPCHVSYILNSASCKFVDKDAAQRLIQPVVFRRDKVVIDETGKAGIQRYRANHSFFNLETDSVDGASILRFDNLMLVNAAGDRLGQAPTDAAEKESKRFDYCMDIHIRVGQNKPLAHALADLEETAVASAPLIEPQFLDRTVTIVFDPPQTNGGGSGPPDP